MKNLITGVVVNYNTPTLLKKAIDSIRNFYDFPIIVIDGSEEPYKIDYEDVFFNGIIYKNVGYNIGHGLGMDMGIKMAKTDYVLTFDTDIEMIEPCIEMMLEKMEEDTYAIGKVYLKNNNSFYNEHRELFPYTSIVYIVHPSFQIVSKKEYLKYAPYISDGAPTVLSYHDVMRHGREKEAFVDFPVLDYIEHKNAGTRNRIERSEYEHPDNPKWLDKWKTFVQENPID